MIINNNRELLKEFRRRKLYLITEEYKDGSKYQGYYVESASKGQAYRYKTITKDNIENIEDEEAYKKAYNCLKNGFKI